MGMSLNKDFDKWRENGYVRGCRESSWRGQGMCKNTEAQRRECIQGPSRQAGGVGRQAGENKTNSPRSVPPQVPRAWNL